jgi:hypothetical protein
MIMSKKSTFSKITQFFGPFPLHFENPQSNEFSKRQEISKFHSYYYTFARLITNFGKFVFGDLGCVIFFTMFSVCKARQARLLKNVNKHFRNFVGQNQQKTKMG